MVTQGWNGYRNKSQHRKLTLEKKILPTLLQGFEPTTFQYRESGALTTELSPPLGGKFWFVFMFGEVGSGKGSLEDMVECYFTSTETIGL